MLLDMFIKKIRHETEHLNATSFYRNGSGDPILLIHAGWTSWRIWTPILNYLAVKHEVLAPTWLGHLGGPELLPGEQLTVETATGKLIETLNEFGFESVHVVGNSVGCVLAFELARRGYARSIVAIDPEGQQSEKRGLWIERLALILHKAARLSFPIAKSAVNIPLVRDILMKPLVINTNHISGPLAEHLLEAFAYCDVSGFFNANRTHEGYIRQIENLNEITCPVKLIWGDKDIMVRRNEIERYMDDLPQAQLLGMKNCGHCPQLEEPAVVAHEILDFVSSIPE